METPPANAVGNQDTAGETEGSPSAEPNRRRPDDATYYAHLRVSLQAASMMWAINAREWPSSVRWRQINHAGQILSNGGDALQFNREASYRKVPGVEPTYTPGTADVFNALARGLGCLAIENPDALGQVWALLEQTPEKRREEEERRSERALLSLREQFALRNEGSAAIEAWRKKPKEN